MHTITMDIFTKAKWARIMVATCVVFMMCVSGFGFWLANSVGSKAADGDAGTELVFNNQKVFEAGAYHTLAIENGKLYAWGSNQYGQVGNSTKTNQSLPVRVGNASNWKSVAAGGMHSLAINTNGQLYAWGQNTYGQLGINNTTDKSDPTQVGTATNWVMVAAGAAHSLAINSAGELWAWGLNDFGQVGDGTTTQRNSPVRVGTATNWTYIDAGYVHSYAINSTKKLFSWGANGAGQLGRGDITDRLTPEQVGTSNWKSISAGTLHTLAIQENGTLHAWGDNTNGQVGDGTVVQRHAPVQIDSRTNWVTVAAGHGHSLATNYDGQLFSWGANNVGQMGDGTTTGKRAPTQITANSEWIDVTAGHTNSYAMNNKKQVVACGDNTYSQLGDGLSARRTAMTRVFPLIDVAAPNAGTGYTVSAPSKTQVSPRGDDSFTFIITSLTGYTRASPIVKWQNPNTIETLSAISTSGNDRTYTIKNITDTVSASDFTIEMPKNVEAAAAGANYTVSEPSVDRVFTGGTYTFTITRASGFATPTVTCSKAKTVVTQVGTSDVFTVTVSNITAPITSGDFTVSVLNRYNVQAPNSVAGVYTVGAVSASNVIDGESYTFTITSLAGYTNGAPRVTLNSSFGTLSTTVATSGNVRTYTVLNVKGAINAGDFGIDVPKNVSVPLVNGTDFTVTAPSVNHVYTGDTYTFTVVKINGVFANPDITLDRNGSMSGYAQSGNNFTYTVSNITGPIVSSDFTTNFNLETFAIATPASGVGYSVSDLTSDRIVIGGSYTFTITSFFGYTNAAPELTFTSSNATLSATVITSVNSRTYTIENVIGNISAGDFKIKMPLNVDGPNNPSDSSYNVSDKTGNWIYAGGEFSFNLTIQEGYTLDKISLNTVGELSPVSKVGNVYKYTITNITSPIVSNNYTVSVEPITHTVEQPSNGTGFVIFSQSLTSVRHNGSYTITLISQSGYNNGAPSVKLKDSKTYKASIALTNTNGSTRTYTVSNVIEPIAADDFEIIAPFNVAAPSGGQGYSVSVPSTTFTFAGGTYTFTITKSVGFTDPVVTFKGHVNYAQLTHTNTDGNKFMYTVSNITKIVNADDFSVETTQIISVAVPHSGLGYTVSPPSRITVDYNGSYTFTITRDSNYTEPTVTLLISTATIARTNANLNEFIFTVSNVTEAISASDFVVTIERIFDVAGPKNGTGYAIKGLSKTSIVYGENYTFTIEIQDGYSEPVVNLNSIYGEVKRVSVNANEYTYEVYNITGNISESDFTVTISKLDGTDPDIAPENNNELDWLVWLIMLIVLALIILICVRVAIKNAKKNRRIEY